MRLGSCNMYFKALQFKDAKIRKQGGDVNTKHTALSLQREHFNTEEKQGAKSVAL